MSAVNDKVKKLRELFAKSTKGKWTWEKDTCGDQKSHTLYAGRELEDETKLSHGFNLFGRLDLDANGENNLELLCKAQQFLPEILDEVERLQEEVERLKGMKP